MSFAVVIPSYNAGSGFERLLSDISSQSACPAYKLLIDSTSTDGTSRIAKSYGWQIVTINKDNFNHGRTRQQAVDILLKNTDIDTVIFLTQDVRLADAASFEKLLAPLANSRVAAVYGRQLPHTDASVYAAVDREYNYPPVSRTKSMQDVRELGIKTAFFSDSFAAYRAQALKSVGGFPSVKICEDMYVAAKLLLAGKSIAYVSEAMVYHSHEPELCSLWQRYRDIGRFHKENPWLKAYFGSSQREGMKLVKYQLAYMKERKGWQCQIKILCMDIIKLLAFKLA